MTLMMCSITYAQRAEEVLGAAGYHTHCENNPDPEGCRYLLKVSGVTRTRRCGCWPMPA